MATGTQKPTSQNGGSASAKPKSKAKPKPAAEAALEEVAPPEVVEPKTVEWKGATLRLPAEPPETMLIDLVLVEGEEADPLQMIRMFRSFLDFTDEDTGEKVTGMIVVRDLIARGKASLEEVPELFAEIMDQYGAGLGESEASPDS